MKLNDQFQNCTHAWEHLGDHWECFECGAITTTNPNEVPLLDDVFHSCPGPDDAIEPSGNVLLKIIPRRMLKRIAVTVGLPFCTKEFALGCIPAQLFVQFGPCYTNEDMRYFGEN